ncbi:unnamed protein product [Psylliodes chrysocephalus]|uniref:Soluble interferon alpha/beta receptor OPG204 n=1 Tax=Psylliodes chrysocephalus TaxID=3402493 RepID=A0A9P0CR75_9CUCU|nr:unnamed protein product [Psylliodes chrysocephala]
MAIFNLDFCLVLLICVLGIRGIKDQDCSANTIQSSDNNMRFTKEATFAEFAVVGKHKALHCCAKGYRTIEWYKDDKPYPWALDTSGLIINPPSGNQTIYVQSVQQKDQGSYTCYIRNETTVLVHRIQLKIFDKTPDEPKITYITEKANVVVGDNLRLFCEAFVGQVDLPDAHSDAYWKKVSPNATMIDLPSHVEQLKTARENGQTLGTYLIINETKPEDLAQYVCIITKPGITIERYVYVREKSEEVVYLDPNPIPVGKMMIILPLIVFVVIGLLIIYWKYGLKIQVRLKDTLNSVEDNDGKEKDVLIIFAPQDTEIAQGVLLPTLQDKYNYKCGVKELTSTINKWYTDLNEEAQKYRRIIAVLSPTLIKDNWESNQLRLALKQLKSLGPQLICISLKELPKNENEEKDAQGETLSTLIRSIGVILWERKTDETFWYALRLKLPPKRKTESETVRSSTTDSRLCDNSQECLENMV